MRGATSIFQSTRHNTASRVAGSAAIGLLQMAWTKVYRNTQYTQYLSYSNCFQFDPLPSEAPKAWYRSVVSPPGTFLSPRMALVMGRTVRGLVSSWKQHAMAVVPARWAPSRCAVHMLALVAAAVAIHAVPEGPLAHLCAPPIIVPYPPHLFQAGKKPGDVAISAGAATTAYNSIVLMHTSEDAAAAAMSEPPHSRAPAPLTCSSSQSILLLYLHARTAVPGPATAIPHTTSHAHGSCTARRTDTTSSQAQPPQAAAGELMEDIDWTEDMPVPIKRRVAALREVQGEYDTLLKEFVRERADLQAKYEAAAGKRAPTRHTHARACMHGCRVLCMVMGVGVGGVGRCCHTRPCCSTLCLRDS